MRAGARGRWELLVLTLLALSAGIAHAVSAPKDKDLIGWLGETYRPREVSPSGNGWVEVVSWDPRIFLYHGFLSPEEIEYLIANAKPKLERSGVSNAETGAGEMSDIRTSSGMWYDRGANPVVKRIEERIARWTMLDAGQGEGFQVLRYQSTQKYDPHHDYFSFAGRDDNGGNRMATVLMYLTDVEQGGETVFPKVPVPPGQKAANYSDCAMKGLAVKPRRGDAVLFWSIRPNGSFDPKSLHGSCPVIKGEKYSMTKWIHVGHYAMGREKPKAVTRVMHVAPPPPIPAGCTNKHKLCEMWAESGECESNPGFMIGSKGNPGSCLASCARCDLMA